MIDSSVWKEKVSAEVKAVMLEREDEIPMTGKYQDVFTSGSYHCGICDTPLFDSKSKYDAGTNIASFFAAINEKMIASEWDLSKLFDERVEIHCANCGGHLGYVYNDGPVQSDLRFSVNSKSLRFTPKN